MRAEQQVAQQLRRRGRRSAPGVDDVAEALRHLLGLDSPPASLVLMRVRPLCIQYVANGLPVSDSDWASSFSWCGNMQVEPAAVDVEASRRGSFMLMAEHSMCQPGRPGPQGLSHAGSPGLAAFQRAKSAGLRFAATLDRARRPPAPPGRGCRACRSRGPWSRRSRRRRRTA